MEIAATSAAARVPTVPTVVARVAVRAETRELTIPTRVVMSPYFTIRKWMSKVL